MMTLDETERFYRSMASYHQNRKRAAEDESRVLWDHCLDLLKAIRECTGSAADVDKLKAVGEERTRALRQLLDRGHAA